MEEMIQCESRVMTYKSVNELPQQFLHYLFIGNSEYISYEFRSTATDLPIPKQNKANFRKGSLSWKQNRGTFSRLR